MKDCHSKTAGIREGARAVRTEALPRDTFRLVESSTGSDADRNAHSDDFTSAILVERVVTLVGSVDPDP